ncbi:hypothetical protein D3C72_1591360 [compost metagenome]
MQHDGGVGVASLSRHFHIGRAHDRIARTALSDEAHHAQAAKGMGGACPSCALIPDTCFGGVGRDALTKGQHDGERDHAVLVFLFCRVPHVAVGETRVCRDALTGQQHHAEVPLRTSVASVGGNPEMLEGCFRIDRHAPTVAVGSTQQELGVRVAGVVFDRSRHQARALR